LPYAKKKETKPWYSEKLKRYNKVLLVTQGTVEKDITKLLIPTLEAFKNSEYLVIMSTGKTETEALQKKYNYDNIIIEDFIPFNEVMPYADVYITNGGYGGVLLSIQNGLPMVVAGVHEGKNEICARVGYFKLGVNLRTEKPTLKQLRESVEEVINQPQYTENVLSLQHEFYQYQPNKLCGQYIAEVISNTRPELKTHIREEAAIY